MADAAAKIELGLQKLCVSSRVYHTIRGSESWEPLPRSHAPLPPSFLPLSSFVRLSHRSSLENIGLGVAVGTIGVCLLQPMLYCKNATQQGLPIFVSPTVYYRGLTMSVTNMSILTAIQFPLTGFVQKLFTGGEARKLSPFEQIGAGFLGGVGSGVACAPMELVLIQQQRFGTPLLATPGKILSVCGSQPAGGLFRGFLMACGREGLFTSGYMGVAPSLGAYLREDQGCSPYVAKMGGSIFSGILAASVSHPLDTVKTCMQGDIQKEKYGTVSQTFSALLKEEGPVRFFRGWTWRTGRMCIAMFLMNECRLVLGPTLFPHHWA